MQNPLRPFPIAILCAALCCPTAQARSKKSFVDRAVDAYQSTNSFTVPAAGTVEVAFSPNEGSEHLVVKVI